MNLNKSYIFSILSITIFIFPVIYYGIKDLEEYQLGYFTLKTYIKYPESFWHGYYDLYGPGVKLPIGHFPIFHPANIFIFNTQLHYFFFITLNLIVQIFFIQKIFRFFFNKSHFIILITVFSISNFNFIYSDDWPGAFFCISIFFPSFYYLIKFLEKKNWIYYYKFVFWVSFGFINGHLGSLTIHYLLFIVLALINRKFFYFKYVKFYLGLLISILIMSSVLFHLLNEFIQFEKNISYQPQDSHSVKAFIFSVFNPFLDTGFQQNRAPYFGIFVPIAFILSVKNLFNIEKSKEILFLDKVFLITIIFSLSEYSKFFYITSAIWQFRDFYNILSIILIFFYFKEKKYFLRILIIVQIFFIISFYLSNFKYIDFSKSNFIVKKIVNNETLFYENANSEFEKTYLSPKVYNKIRNGFKNYGTYSVTDLQLRNVYTFNGWFKNYSVDDLQKPETKMHGKINSSYEDLDNTSFLKNFLIKKIIFFKSESQHFNIVNYKINKIVKFEYDDLIYAEITNKNFPILENNNQPTLNCNEKEIFIKCLLHNNSKLGLVEIKRVKLNQYEIFNKNPYDVDIIFPFLEYKNWFNETKKIKNYDKLRKVGSLSLAANEKIIFTYKDNLRLTLNIISSLSLTVLLLVILIKKKFN